MSVENIVVGGIYRHRNGKLYKVLAIARDVESYELRVIYQGLYTCPTYGKNPIWDRSLEGFSAQVEIDGIWQPRFKLEEKSL